MDLLVYLFYFMTGISWVCQIWAQEQNLDDNEFFFPVPPPPGPMVPQQQPDSFSVPDPPPAPQSVPVPDVGSSDLGPAYQQHSLQLHNYFRNRHHVGPLQINMTLYEKALKCARYYCSIGKMDHKCPNKLVEFGIRGDMAGENIWRDQLLGKFSPRSPDEIVQSTIDLWYHQEKGFRNFQSQFSEPSTHHFTQMIWKGSRDFGFAISSCPLFTLAVALYYPEGNVEGTYVENVFPE